MSKRRERGSEGKVLVVVKTLQLATQLSMRLRDCLGGVKIIGLAEETDHAIYSALLHFDVIVCTAGNLCGELHHSQIHISDVTLLVLDECHHTCGRSPYAEVMEHYLLDKTNGRDVPHVIGMTASPGAGRGRLPSLEKAIEHQIKLCARIDATSGIKCVQENIAELNSVVSPPSYNRHALSRRSAVDSFILVLSKVMKDLEGLLPVPSTPTFDHCSLGYLKWIKDEIEAAQLNQMSQQRNQISVLKLLEVYHIALITYEDFEIENAKEILNTVNLFDASIRSDFERYLEQLHNQTKIAVDSISGLRNPLLVEVEQLLINHFGAKPDSKALFFVRAADHTQYVTQWIRKNFELSQLIRPCSVTGYRNKGTMLKHEQLKIIQDFSSGKYNLLVTTSVLEEHFNVPKCNMVIRFHVTSNEAVSDVPLIQGRAHSTHTIVTSESPVLYHLLLSNDKNEQSNEAARLISQKGIDLDSIVKLQKEILDARELRIKEESERSLIWNPEDVDLLCCKCGTVACNAAEICKFGKTGAVIVPSQSFVSNKMKKISRKRPEPPAVDEFSRPFKIVCFECSEEWGVWGNWKKSCVQYPVLQCKKFTFRNNKTLKRQRVKQWKLVPFEVMFYAEFQEKDV